LPAFHIPDGFFMGVRSFSRKSNIILRGAPRDLRIALSERWPQSFAAPQPAEARLSCCRKIQQDAISRRLMFAHLRQEISADRAFSVRTLSVRRALLRARLL
jgi:hypothetical protein